jgi:uncharacterized protein YjbI with pentapeptide repeats
MAHPYTDLEGTHLWKAVDGAVDDLVLNNDLIEGTPRTHIVGYLCQKIWTERQGLIEELISPSKTINSGNLSAIEWNESYFKFCNFEAFSFDGGLVSSDFHSCLFEKIDWYGGFFSGCNFIDCKFVGCTFAGTAFAYTRFIDCKLVNCTFKKDNMGGDCDFSTTIAYGCSVENTFGYQSDASATISNFPK